MLALTSDDIAGTCPIFFEKSIQQTRFTLVLCFRLIKKSIRSQRDNFVSKKSLENTFSPKTSVKSSFLGFTKKSSTLPRVVWAGKSKTGLGFEIGPRQQKFQRSPIVHLTGNPAVVFVSCFDKKYLSSKLKLFM